jgi:uncharacterized protein YjeT (DUF2065 family)
VDDLLVALALAIALEGALYALFPNGMRQAMVHILSQPADRIRVIGLLVCAAGVGLVWLIRS